MNWRGRYEGGDMEVTARHWWSPRDRKSARIAARVLEYERGRSGGFAKAYALSHWPDPIVWGEGHPARWETRDG